jgi:hypothetical protein
VRCEKERQSTAAIYQNSAHAIWGEEPKVLGDQDMHGLGEYGNTSVELAAIVSRTDDELLSKDLLASQMGSMSQPILNRGRHELNLEAHIIRHVPIDYCGQYRKLEIREFPIWLEMA